MERGCIYPLGILMHPVAVVRSTILLNRPHQLDHISSGHFCSVPLKIALSSTDILCAMHVFGNKLDMKIEEVLTKIGFDQPVTQMCSWLICWFTD